VAPEGRPEVEKVTAWEDPEVRVAVMTLLVDCPRVTDLLPPWASEKSKLEAGGEALFPGTKFRSVVSMI